MRSSGSQKFGRLCFIGLFVLAMLTAACTASAKESSHGATGPTQSDVTTTSLGGMTSTLPSTTASTVAPTRLSLIVEPQAGMTPIYSFMSSARQSLDMTMYELSDATAEQILIADHKKGVQVRVLLDHDYSGGSVNQTAYSALSAAGVSVRWANDSQIFHQKTITVDSSESAIMTGNLTSEYYPTTRDFVVLDSQPPDVAAIESVFGSDWSGAAPSSGPSGTDLVWSPGSEPQLVTLIDSALHSVVVENEEMDSSAIENALEADAQRAVSVTVVMTSDSDWDSAFAKLESAGVHVVLYADTASALYIHAKVIDVDSAEVFIGSENFSTASLDDNRELGLITSSTAVLAPLSISLYSDISGGQREAASAPTSIPPTTSAPPPLTTAGSGDCYPIDDEGGCYEPGEYCRDDDHGVTGRAGDGEPIICEYDNGWYWEPT
jgi:cardiolipin synthase